MASPFVVVEGLDGSGKSTLSTALAERMGAVWATTPSPALRSLRTAILADFGDDPIAIQLFYAATVRAASTRAAAAVRAGRPVVLDRYWLSTMVYAKERAAFLGLPDVARTLHRADLTVFLDTPLAIRRSRLLARGTSAADVETLDPARDAALRRGYREAASWPVVGRFLVLDGGTESVAGLVARVLDALGTSHRSAASDPAHPPCDAGEPPPR